MEKRRTTLVSDLVAEIFLWLQVKPILRFRCVSKSLCSLIDSRNFKKEHLQKSMENKTNRKLIIHELHPSNSPGWIELEEFYAANLTEDYLCRNRFNEDRYEKYYDKLNHPYERKLGTRIRGCCNGILLLQICDIHVLWNPFTRRCKKLPDVERRRGNCYIGLGYDHVSDDYKVVMFTIDGSSCPVFVFSLKLNYWRSVPDFPFADYAPRYYDQAFFGNGALYWFSNKRVDVNNYTKGIIGLDLTKETFYEAPQPNYTPYIPSPNDYSIDSIDSYTSLHVSEGCLVITHTTSIFSYEEGHNQELKEVHVRESEGGAFTWRKLDDRFQNQLLLAYSKEGDKVWLHNEDRREIICYDLQHESEIKVLDLPYYYNLAVCWESLVPVGDGSIHCDVSLNYDDLKKN